MLSNIYAAAGKWDLSEDVQYQRFNMESEKQPCHIWIDMSKAVHMFVVNYHDHPQGLKFRQGWRDFWWMMPAMCQTRNLSRWRTVVSIVWQARNCPFHFWLISMPPGTTLCLIKKLHVCGDCHTSTYFTTEVDGRAITAWDAYSFHHFEDGVFPHGEAGRVVVVVGHYHTYWCWRSICVTVY